MPDITNELYKEKPDRFPCLGDSLRSGVSKKVIVFSFFGLALCLKKGIGKNIFLVKVFYANSSLIFFL